MVPLVFAQGAQPQDALVTDGMGLVTDVNGLTVDGVIYDIAFESGTYNALFGTDLFPNAGNIVDAINAELNALNPLTPLINTGSGAESSYVVPRVNNGALFIIADRGRCGIVALDLVTCLASSSWSGPPLFLVPAKEGEITFAVPTVVSAVPLPAALPLFGSALAMLGIVGWRRKRMPAA